MNTDALCPDRERLQAFRLGQLPAPDAQSVEKHLRNCAACQGLLRDFAREGLRQTTPFKPSGASDAVRPANPPFSYLLPPVETDEIGRLGNFRVLRVLGSGGMGTVFLAEDIALRRRVALKVMKPDLEKDVEADKRFLNEARAMAAIKHEHLITIYQAGTEGNVVFLAMELLEGESLDEFIARRPRPRVGEILRIGREIASGLAIIHQPGLIHRDVKPANIWLEGPGARVKILDFGLARSIHDKVRLTQAGFILGTPAFMSPEQARGDTVDARSDLFSLGSTLYALCTGAMPFQAKNTAALLMALAAETPRPVYEVNPRIPEELSELVMQLLAKNAKDRPASAAEVVQRIRLLERTLTSPTHEIAPSTVHRPPVADGAAAATRKKSKKIPARTRRRQKITLLVVGAVLTVLAGLGLARLLVGPPAPSLSPTDPANAGADDQRVYLTDLNPLATEHWPMSIPRGGPPRKLAPGEKVEVMVGGKLSPHGIFMHPPPPPDEGQPTSVTYRLQGEYETFHTEISLNDTARQALGDLTFTVYGDGKVLHSVTISSQRHSQAFSVTVKNVNVLKIEVTPTGGEIGGAHAVWIEPYLTK